MTIMDAYAGVLDFMYGTSVYGTAAVIADLDWSQTPATVIFSQEVPAESRAANGPAMSGMVRVRVSEMATLAAGYTVTIGADVWEVIGEPRLSEDGLEWFGEVQKR